MDMKAPVGTFADLYHAGAEYDVEPAGIHRFVQPLPAIRGQRQAGIIGAVWIPGGSSGKKADMAAQPDELNGGIDTAFIAADDSMAANSYGNPPIFNGR